MPALKRKADQGTAHSKKEKPVATDRSAKRPRKSDAAADGAPSAKPPVVKPDSTAQRSIFKDEERSFPRGGASVLTPLEHKQIQIKANQDVLFEQAGQKRTGDDGLSDEGSDAGTQERPKENKKKRSKKTKTANDDEEKERVVRVESLSSKKLVAGTMVLGQVADFTSRDLVLALPNNLVGYVPLTAISDKLTERLEKMLNDDEGSDAESADEHELSDVNLKNLFVVGQYLRAYVTSTPEDAVAAKTRKRIELSLHPKLVNQGISKSSLTVNSVVQASVISNEDHGLVMDMGLDEPGLKGFLSKRELDPKVDFASIQEGTVFMCLVSGVNPDGRIVKLSADHQKAGNLKKLSTLTNAPTVDVFLPGAVVDLLVTDSTLNTVTGKILGLIDATVDTVHSGSYATTGADFSEKCKIGTKVKARIIFTCPNSETKKVGVSLLEHVLSLSTRMSGKPKERKNPLDTLSISSFVEEAKVVTVAPKAGLYFDLGIRDVLGFAHISRLKEEKVEMLSETTGEFKIGTKHRTRIIGYNLMDGLYQLSLEQKILDQPFLCIEDIKVGQVVKGKVQKLFADKKGSTGVLVNISEGIIGLVTELHLSDVRLQHPERKFREGATVTARVLSTDVGRHEVLLTLKKSLVNSDVQPWAEYSQITEGATGPGTLVDVRHSGALVRFYGNVKAWLPTAEMSEAYIEDATRHFQKGQVVNVRVLSVDPAAGRMLVSCKDPTVINGEKEALFKSLKPGDIVKGVVVEKSLETVAVDLGHGVKGVLRVGHLTDGSEKKNLSTMSRIRVGGPLEDVVVLEKHSKSHTVHLSNKPSLRKDAQAHKLVSYFEDVHAGNTVHGFVRGLLPDKVFIEFGGGVVGLLFKSQLLEDMIQLPNFGLRKDQSVTARVTHIDSGKELFWLSMRPEAETTTPSLQTETSVGEATVNAVDQNIKSTQDLVFGTTMDVRIKSVKSDQVNVQIADNIQGRISVAEVFNEWEDIEDKKHPLAQLKMQDIMQVKVLGRHDARNYRFLPITHRQGKTPIFELTAKKGELTGEGDVLAMQNIIPGSSLIAFVNNHADRYVWVTVSANVRGRIDFFDLTDDLTLLADVEKNFPVGCALKVRVKAVDAAAARLDLTAASAFSAHSMTLNDLKEGLVLPARVTKINASSIVVQINKNIAAPIYLQQLSDDYDTAKPSGYKTGDILRVCVVDIDTPNKKLGLSARPSRVLSSSLSIKDPEITDKSQLKIHQVIRGYIKRVDDNGIYVRLGLRVDAFVRVTHLSDSFIKEWKPQFQVDQLVTGKIISTDGKNPQMSLKRSVVEGTYVKQLEFSDVTADQIVTATVRRVLEHGVILVVANSNNVSGMCHISQLADNRVKNIKDLYKEGDVVKAKILRVDQKQRRISFGLKYSYVKSDEEQNDDEEMNDASDLSAADSDDQSMQDEVSEDEDAEMRSVKSAESEHGSAAEADARSEDDDDTELARPSAGLSTSGFDWTGATLDFDERQAASESSSDEDASKKKKKPKKATIKEDRTGDLDAYGPQSIVDYERLLLGQPNSAELWVRYMVFQRDLNEIEKARQIARRALATINPREEKEKLDVWTALLHLENEFGSNELVEDTFKEACQYNDSREIHERMIKIYVSSGKLDKADNLYQSMIKNKSFTPTPSLWLSYATFLMGTLQPPSAARARNLLARATQSVPDSQHRHLTEKFAALEFKSPNGDSERGRTIFEGLVSTWPNKGDIWDVYLSLEMAHGGQDNVRDLFERMSKLKLKKKRAATVFSKWASWEESVGNNKGVDKVRTLEREWAEKRQEKDEE
ncbi:hypothetical protein BDV95DRAFT_489219 [Massariosphaeria phaeospora]|uniref:rRNA biogenesis protein RRP5 n=1 Tax=Massariosphaeria phaeospora TaxID=100035 RepID=A0A7C8MSD1_9PLEO|nr:hypothetical protein BDV95DRAFT_489219 [Massariosphaeria phaeospora]